MSSCICEPKPMGYLPQWANDNYKMYPASYIIQYAKKTLSLEHTKSGTAPPEIGWIGHLGTKHGMTHD